MPRRPVARPGRCAAVLLLATLAAASAFCQQARDAGTKSGAAGWAALRNQKPTVVGSLRMADCNGYPGKPCREYLVQALQYHWKELRPNELKVTNLDRHRVILVDRDVDGFLYMLPLYPSGNLLATVWISGDGSGSVKIYRLDGDFVRVIFYDGSKFTPQLIEGSESTPNPVILLDRGYVMRGNAILPTDTEIWQWNPAAEKFVLRATVPVEQRFAALAKLEHEAKKK